MKKIFICFFIILFLPCLKSNAQKDPIVIVIDPGHGGENLGTIENGFCEKEMTLKTALAMKEELEKYDNILCYLTREDDSDLDLKERATFAKSVNADFLFSIHYNASIHHRIYGAEVWISLKEPFHAQGYQFATLQLENMETLGLNIRGIKTRESSRGDDYYGIIRQSIALGIPAVLIEHCHVDVFEDAQYCNTDEKLETLGRANADAIAKYFQLSSTQATNYSDYTYDAMEISLNELIPTAFWDETPPEICEIESIDVNYEKGEILLKITASDEDTPLVYYDYSLDAGITFSELNRWPNGETTFTMNLQIPEGMIPVIVIRAYNMYDTYTQSNMLSGFKAFPITIIEDEPEENELEIIVIPLVEGEETSSKIYIIFSVICILLLFFLVWLSRIILKKK